jgi:hypothetical protein
MSGRPRATGPTLPTAPLAAALLSVLLAGLPTGRSALAADDPAAAAPAAMPADATGAGAPPGRAMAAAAPAAAAAAPTAAEDIRDIRGPKYILPPWMIIAALAGVALLAAAGYALWRGWRSRRRPRVLLPFERALEQLDGIRPLMQPASAREFSIAVSDIVRGYIEERFDVVATHLTTEEFMHDLLQTPKPALVRHRSLLADFLQQCDLVKFGGMSLSMHSIESLHDSARGFVLETAKPDPVTPLPAIKEAHDTLPAA